MTSLSNSSQYESVYEKNHLKQKTNQICRRRQKLFIRRKCLTLAYHQNSLFVSEQGESRANPFPFSDNESSADSYTPHSQTHKHHFEKLLLIFLYFIYLYLFSSFTVDLLWLLFWSVYIWNVTQIKILCIHNRITRSVFFSCFSYVWG